MYTIDKFSNGTAHVHVAECMLIAQTVGDWAIVRFETGFEVIFAELSDHVLTHVDGNPFICIDWKDREERDPDDQPLPISSWDKILGGEEGFGTLIAEMQIDAATPEMCQYIYNNYFKYTNAHRNINKENN